MKTRRRKIYSKQAMNEVDAARDLVTLVSVRRDEEQEQDRRERERESTKESSERGGRWAPPRDAAYEARSARRGRKLPPHYLFIDGGKLGRDVSMAPSYWMRVYREYNASLELWNAARG